MNKEFIYNNVVVRFFHADQLMVNATEMATVFESDVNKFLEENSTKNWIKWLENNLIRGKRNGESVSRTAIKGVAPGVIRHKSADLVPILTVEKIDGGNTVFWMHHLLATDFAQWLNIDFKGWIILKVNELLFNYTMEKRQLEIEKITLQNKLKQIDSNESAKNPAVKEVFDILRKLDQNKGDAFNLNKSFKNDLFNN
ncbi:KilA-N domain-containing protein [Mucilaginibacter aquatilis]|nr:KilA-N domain-containing protein [Mucilaginibacter aquatilis]